MNKSLGLSVEHRFSLVVIAGTAKSIILPSLLIAASVLQGYAQLQVAGGTKERWFDQWVGIENAGIINGPEYKMETLGKSSNPFFGEGRIQGIVRYNGQLFHVPLLYDIYKDVIVVRHLSASGREWLVELEKDRLDEFVISGSLFKNLNNQFHEVIYEGHDFQLVCRRAKVLQLRNRILNYIENDRFYMIHSGQWKPLRNGTSLSKMLPDSKDQKQLKTFIKKNRIRVNKFRKEDLVKIATFFDGLLAKKQ